MQNNNARLYIIMFFFISVQTSNSQSPVWNYCGGKVWDSDSNNLYNGIPSSTSGVIKGNEPYCIYKSITGPGEVSFVWRKGPNISPAFYVNYSSYIDGVMKAQCNETNWENISLPIESGAHGVKWEIKLDARTRNGICPSSASGIGWLANVSEQIPIIPNPKNVSVSPTEGDLNETYTYNISRNYVESCPELTLEIWDPCAGRWKSFGDSKWNLDNVTFVVPGLSFMKLPYIFDDIRYRFKNCNGYFGPFIGPYINIFYKNQKFQSSNSISVDVKSDRPREICLKCDNETSPHKGMYSDINNDWETLIFEGTNQTCTEADIGVCNE